MSDEEVTVETTDRPVLTAEYKDGQLQIVEVTPFEKNDRESNVIPSLSDDGDQPQYMQILDGTKNFLQLDLMNLTIVRCEGGEDSYQIVTNPDPSVTGDMRSDTVTCVLQASDTEENDNQDGSYVMVEDPSGDGSLVYLKTAGEGTSIQKMVDSKKALTPAEILEKAKALQKAKALELRAAGAGTAGTGATGAKRKRRSDLPPPHELLASPNFKLYLYSCKHCPYKCNAVKEMWAHKAAEHAGGARRGGGRGPAVTLQCARCPYRGATHTQLMKHVQDKHLEPTSNRVHLNTEEVEAADVLVCGACGFESASRPVFRKHIEEEHGATTC